jgi:Ser/Thr protein kinase RdoA (MazF antagonist)
VLRAFGLAAARVLGRTDAGTINDNWVVIDADGRKLLVRCYRRITRRDRVEYQLRLQEHLRANGIPTAAVVPAPDGGRVLDCGGLLWATFEYVEGSEYNFGRIDQARAAGRLLAQYHRVAASFPEKRVPVSDESFADFIAAGPSEPERLKDMFAGCGVDREVEAAAAWWRGFSRDWPPERIAMLPEAFLHYDYHGRNLLFRDDAVVGLFDFDYAGPGRRVVDVSRGLFNFARSGRFPVEPGDPPGPRRLRASFARAFLQAYEDLSPPLAPEEREALPAIAAWNFAPSAYWYSRWFSEGLDLAARLKRDLALLSSVGAEFRRIGPALGLGVS